MMKKKDKKVTIEDAFIRLDEIVKQLEFGEISLDESFSLYKEGMELVNNCASSIDEVEKKIKVLNKEGEVSEF